MKKFTKILAFAATACLAAALVAGCSGAPEKQEPAAHPAPAEQKTPEADAPAQATKLIVGYDNSYPPYGFIGDDGNLTGFDIDLATEVAARNGWNLELEAIDWDAKDALLGSGAINCIWNGFTMEGREGKYAFSKPYMHNEQVVVVKKDSGINKLEDLADKNVMTQADSAALDVLEGDQKTLADTFAGGKAQTIGDYNNAFMQLESGMVDAVACDLSIAAYQMAANPGAYTQLPTSLSSEHYAVGFKKGDTELAKQVTDALKELYADGTVQKLCEKYADYGVTVDNWVLFE